MKGDVRGVHVLLPYFEFLGGGNEGQDMGLLTRMIGAIWWGGSED